MKNKQTYFPDTGEYSLKEFTSQYTAMIKKAFDCIKEDDLEAIFEALASSIRSEKTIYTCGNGGSASIAEHLVCDFIKGTATDSELDPKVIPLLTTPVITAIGNDIGYEEIFSYQIKKYAGKEDVLLCVSSSGDSPNIIKAIVNTWGIKRFLFLKSIDLKTSQLVNIAIASIFSIKFSVEFKISNLLCKFLFNIKFKSS